MKPRIRGYVRINAQGKKLYKFINMMHEQGIGCRSQYCRGDIFFGDIFRADLKSVRNIAEECSIELKAAEYDSLSARLYRYRRRTGLIIGFLLAITAAIYFSRVVVTIEINGNSAVSDEIILNALAELDIKPGTPVHRLDLKSCENRLRLMIDDISWVGIRHTGSRIVVQIREVTPVPQLVRNHVPCNIIATRDAEISSVLVECGSLVHIVGDYVPKGSLLISGVYEDDRKHSFIYHAMGEIRGTYEETVSFSGAFLNNEYTPTGNTDNERRLKLFSLDIPLSFGKNHYKSSTSQLSESRLSLFGKELPISLERRKIIETEPTEHTLSEEELTEKLMERVYLYEKNFLGDDTKIVSRTITPVSTDDTLTLNVTYKLDGIISEQRDLFIKNPKSKYDLS